MKTESSLFRSIRVCNLLTYVSTFSSLLAVAFAARGSASAAGLCIGFSSLLDVFDGKFAKLFQRTGLEKKMGVEIDSLADSIAFGSTPVLCLVFLGAGQTWSLVAGGIYVVAALTRLSFYNVMALEEDARDFVGVPTTVIGVLWTLILLFPGSLFPGPCLFSPLRGPDGRTDQDQEARRDRAARGDPAVGGVDDCSHRPADIGGVIMQAVLFKSLILFVPLILSGILHMVVVRVNLLPLSRGRFTAGGSARTRRGAG